MKKNNTIQHVLPIAVLVFGLMIAGAGCPKKTETDTTIQNTNSVDSNMPVPAMEDESDETPGVTESSVEIMGSTSSTDDEISMEENEDMEEPTEEKTEEKTKPGSYEAYSESKVAQADGKKVVLFFHAAWCPTCRTLESDINGQLENIPSDVMILKVDYDTALTLRQKYGVTIQHTLVHVDTEGNQISKWSGGNELSTITSRL